MLKNKIYSSINQKWNKSHRVRKAAEARACWARGLGEGRMGQEGRQGANLPGCSSDFVSTGLQIATPDAFLLQGLLLPCTLPYPLLWQ